MVRSSAALAAVLLVAGCFGAGDLDGTGSSWPDADGLFRDERWLGSDGAMTIPLGDGRILWVFGDTLVARSPGSGRSGSFFVSNTMATMEGLDPSSATMTFHWRERSQPPEGPTGPLPPPLGPEPGLVVDPILPDEGTLVHWPGNGIEIGGTLLLFATRLDRGEGPFGFEARGWTAFRVTDTAGPPTRWTFEPARTTHPFGDAVFVGAGSVFVADGSLHAFAVRSHSVDGWTEHDPFLARWPLPRALEGDLTEPQWYDPASGSWVPEADLDTLPAPLFRPGAPNFSVHHDRTLGAWVEIQSTGFGTAPVQARIAERPEGPWSEAVTVFEPPEMADPDLLLYAAVAHPELEGAPLVVTYSVNTVAEDRVGEEGTYLPRFAKVELRTR